jgi:hypothetical protein
MIDVQRPRPEGKMRQLACLCQANLEGIPGFDTAQIHDGLEFVADRCGQIVWELKGAERRGEGLPLLDFSGKNFIRRAWRRQDWRGCRGRKGPFLPPVKSSCNDEKQ